MVSIKLSSHYRVIIETCRVEPDDPRSTVFDQRSTVTGDVINERGSPIHRGAMNRFPLRIGMSASWLWKMADWWWETVEGVDEAGSGCRHRQPRDDAVERESHGLSTVLDALSTQLALAQNTNSWLWEYEANEIFTFVDIERQDPR
ncbi:hypothetical protein N7462_009774 [Penicillium macrosclerotiorum]|uniref:uncharacterized protein n=1 Tax=Penicillium macrosclerotiorum TaxID=303699 RepID=UPI00254675A3|nr:uncharacterized protein N7462_009774 [Penicillium macrosclerotiorum]KAJ5668704.1 hypothetical protein N7462_009774 [Penicillium macrosclerotiorum]